MEEELSALRLTDNVLAAVNRILIFQLLYALLVALRLCSRLKGNGCIFQRLP